MQGITFKPANVPFEDVSEPFPKRNSLPWEEKKQEPTVIRQSPNKYPVSNGLIYSVTHAYSRHHKLILRPDDIWTAITTQFSIYVEQNAEALRKKFVSFSGKKELEVTSEGTLFTAPYPVLCMNMAEQIAKNIKDPSIRDWIVPNFSTTTEMDRVVGSIVLMAAMKKYFDYKMSLCCGLPEVTLLGTKEDWEELYNRAKRLPEFEVTGMFSSSVGSMKKWYNLLEPVLKNFVQSASGKPNLEWWNKCCHYKSGGSGPTMISGWITVFSVFNDSKKWVGETLGPGGWPILDDNDLTVGTVEVDILIDDNGAKYKTVMSAGSIGVRINGNCIHPVNGFKLVLKDGEALQGINIPRNEDNVYTNGEDATPPTEEAKPRFKKQVVAKPPPLDPKLQIGNFE